MRGRKPKPTAVKKISGNPGKRKLNTREPKPSVSARVEPAQINAGMKTFGDHYLPLLKEMLIFTDVDLAAFELMSWHYATAWRAAQIVEKQGLTLIDKFGQAHKHPALQILRDNSALFKSYASEFGMTPSSRSRIQVPDVPMIDQLELDLFGADAKVLQ